MEADGSLRRGRGVKSRVNSFDRDSVEKGEDGLRHQKTRLTVGERRNILDVNIEVRIL